MPIAKTIVTAIISFLEVIIPALLIFIAASGGMRKKRVLSTTVQTVFTVMYWLMALAIYYGTIIFYSDIPLASLNVDAAALLLLCGLLPFVIGASIVYYGLKKMRIGW